MKIVKIEKLSKPEATHTILRVDYTTCFGLVHNSVDVFAKTTLAQIGDTRPWFRLADGTHARIDFELSNYLHAMNARESLISEEE